MYTTPYVCIYTYVHNAIHMYMYICIHMLSMHTYLCKCHTCMCIHMCVYVCVYVHLYMPYYPGPPKSRIFAVRGSRSGRSGFFCFFVEWLLAEGFPCMCAHACSLESRARICVYMHVHSCTWCVRLCVSVETNIDLQTHTGTHTQTYRQTQRHTPTHTDMFCTRTHARTHARTHTHANTLVCTID